MLTILYSCPVFDPSHLFFSFLFSFLFRCSSSTYTVTPSILVYPCDPIPYLSLSSAYLDCLPHFISTLLISSLDVFFVYFPISTRVTLRRHPTLVEFVLR